MNTKTSIAFAGAALAVLLGCSTPKPADPVAAAATAPPVFIQYESRKLLPPEMPWYVPFGMTCKLGTSCLAIDPRPFEPCLLSTKDCRDKAAEPKLVDQPQWLVPPTVIETAN